MLCCTYSVCVGPSMCVSFFHFCNYFQIIAANGTAICEANCTRRPRVARPRTAGAHSRAGCARTCAAAWERCLASVLVFLLTSNRYSWAAGPGGQSPIQHVLMYKLNAIGRVSRSPAKPCARPYLFSHLLSSANTTASQPLGKARLRPKLRALTQCLWIHDRFSN
jgi:hypothetical protein